MKKLLIVQLDDSYFLFETFQVLEKNISHFKDFDLTFLVDEKSYKTVFSENFPLIRGICFQVEDVLKQSYDLSINLSLEEKGWDIQGQVKADRKIGSQRINGALSVGDLWSTYFLTIKNKTPFVTFHLQQIYRCILGIHHSTPRTRSSNSINRIAYDFSNPSFFSLEEQEKFVTGLSDLFPEVHVCEISEIDIIDNVTQTLYLGPPSLNSLRLCEAGASGYYLTSHFQGFNLIPASTGTFVISCEGSEFSALKLLRLIGDLKRSGHSSELSYSVYEVEDEDFNGPFLRCHGKSDLNYPFYQAHVILWNFLLNISDVELTILNCSPDQLRALESNFHVVSKFLRLHHYAIKSVDQIHLMSKKDALNPGEFHLHLKTLSEVDQIAESLSASHSFLRPFFNFYKILKSQGNISTLAEEAQSSFLIYSEEHKAFEALKELFFVTLKKNEVTI